MLDYYHQHHQDSPVAGLFPGAAETVEALLERGYRLAVATGMGRSGLDKALQASGLSRHMVASRTADLTASKPNPKMLQEIFAQTAISHQQAIMVGDTDYDLLMARNASAAAIAALYGSHDTERLVACEPLGTLSDITLLPALMDELSG